jgi:hypothetical protein
MKSISGFELGFQRLWRTDTVSAGALIRGGNITALNNEAVAEMLETLAGVNARKTTKRVL